MPPDAPPPDPAPTADERWVAAISRGDEAAFEKLFLAHYDRLQAYAERLVQWPDVAEELIGNVFARIWERRTEWKLRQSLSNYLYAAVRNEALMWFEHEQVVDRAHDRGVREQRSPGMGQPPIAADEQAEASELATALEASIERLPPRMRDAYLLSRRYGLTYPEIAEEMGIAVKTVEIHIGRALTALRADLARFLA